MKRKLYVEAGVPFYLVVDPKEVEVTATTFELGQGSTSSPRAASRAC